METDFNFWFLKVIPNKKALTWIQAEIYWSGSNLLGSRPMAGHTALDRRIGVRIPAPQPYCIYEIFLPPMLSITPPTHRRRATSVTLHRGDGCPKTPHPDRLCRSTLSRREKVNSPFSLGRKGLGDRGDKYDEIIIRRVLGKSIFWDSILIGVTRFFSHIFLSLSLILKKK